MRCLVTTTGSHGDVHPYIAVARALKERGHEVRFLVHPHFHPDVRAAGIDPAALGEHFDLLGVLRDPDLMHRRRGGRVVLRLMLETIPELRDTFVRHVDAFAPDVVLAHQICFAARWHCKRENIPHAIGTLSPLLWWSRQTPVATMQQRPGALAYWTAKAVFAAGIPFMRFWTDLKFNAIRRSLGYELERQSLRNDFLGGDVNLGLWSPVLRGPAPDDPPHGVICGFPWHDGSHHELRLSADIERFLGDGPAPLVFCLGTAASHSAGDFHEQAAAAAAKLNRRAILLVGRGVEPPRSLPAGVMAAPYAPFSLLLHRAAAVVHHGGIGSTAQALRSGRPQLVIPHAHDQFNNALLAHRLGVARMLARHRLTVPRLTRELDRLLSDPSHATRAAEVGPRISSEDGARVAAEQLERIGRKERNQSTPFTPLAPETPASRG